MFINFHDKIQGLVDEFKEIPSETVYEQSVRYGKLAFTAFKLKLALFQDDESYSWKELPEEQKRAWIEVGVQIEQITLKENQE